MEALIVLIPISIVLFAIAAAIFVWAVERNQFERLDQHAFDILDEDPGDEK